LRNKTECQDYVAIGFKEQCIILSVADGHGTSKFGLDGARIAVRLFINTIKDYIKEFPDMEQLRTSLIRSKNHCLPKSLVSRWTKGVRAQHLREKRVEQFTARMYGTTLLGLVITPGFYFALQIGDGDIICVNEAGCAERVLETDKILGVETYSLSLDSAWRYAVTELRSFPSNEEMPALFMLSTDGYANSFVDDAGFRKAGSDYLSLMRQRGVGFVKKNLGQWLTRTSERGSGDDISIAFAFHKSKIANAPRGKCD